MHEISIAQNIINQVDSFIYEKQLTTKVKKVHLKIGKLACVIPSNLEFIFKILTKDTNLNDVELAILEIPILCKCLRCEINFGIKDEGFICPQCQSFDIEIKNGRELMIEKIEVE
jgi:hydrogenase nickel incorporation protein HypA/HybF